MIDYVAMESEELRTYYRKARVFAQALKLDVPLLTDEELEKIADEDLAEKAEALDALLASKHDAPEEVPAEKPAEVPTATAPGEGDAQVNQLKDQLLRVAADFENFKRRTADERQQMAQTARLDVILDLLPVIDNFERAFKEVPDEVSANPWYGGVSAIKAQFDKLLADFGVERMPGVGSEFDPNQHEAIAHEPSKEFAENIISEEFEAGYRHGDTVIRHGRVKVSSGKES